MPKSKKTIVESPKLEAEPRPPPQPKTISGDPSPPEAQERVPTSAAPEPPTVEAPAPKTFEEQAAKSILKIAEAVEQISKVVSNQGEQIGRLNEAVMELHQQPQQQGGGDLMALANSPLGKSIVDALTKYLAGPQGSDPYQSMITEDAKREVSEMFKTVVKGRWQTAISLAKAAEAGQLEWRVSETPPPPPSFDPQPKPGGDEK